MIHVEGRCRGLHRWLDYVARGQRETTVPYVPIRYTSEPLSGGVLSRRKGLAPECDGEAEGGGATKRPSTQW